MARPLRGEWVNLAMESKDEKDQLEPQLDIEERVHHQALQQLGQPQGEGKLHISWEEIIEE